MKSSRLSHSRAIFASVIAAGMLAAVPLTAAAQSDEASLQKGAMPDVTPQQRYQSGIREAGGGLKVSLEECRAMAGADRKGCESQAQARYRADMARAKAMLKDPSVRPFDVTGEPIRSTETTYVVKP